MRIAIRLMHGGEELAVNNPDSPHLIPEPSVRPPGFERIQTNHFMTQYWKQMGTNEAPCCSCYTMNTSLRCDTRSRDSLTPCYYSRYNYLIIFTQSTLTSLFWNWCFCFRSHNLVVHTNPESWKYFCEMCNKRFPIKSNFDCHMRRHTGDKKFECHLCNKKFTDKCVLQRHMRTHTNIRDFKCSECSREYKDKRVMQIHMAKVHGIGKFCNYTKDKYIYCVVGKVPDVAICL